MSPMVSDLASQVHCAVPTSRPQLPALRRSVSTSRQLASRRREKGTLPRAPHERVATTRANEQVQATLLFVACTRRRCLSPCRKLQRVHQRSRAAQCTRRAKKGILPRTKVAR